MCNMGRNGTLLFCHVVRGASPIFGELGRSLPLPPLKIAHINPSPATNHPLARVFTVWDHALTAKRKVCPEWEEGFLNKTNSSDYF